MRITNSQIPLFKILTPSERKKFFDWSNVKEYNEGDFLFKADDKRDKFFVIVSGEVELSSQKENVFNIFSSGEFLGEAALIEPGTYHSLNSRAKTKVSAIVLDYKDFKKLEKESPELGIKVLEYICLVMIERLYHADNKLITLYRTGKIIGSNESIEQSAKEILDAALDVIAAKKGIFALLDVNNKVKVKSSFGYSTKDKVNKVSFDLESDKLFEKVYTEKETFVLTKKDIDNNKKKTSKIWPADSAIITPIIVSNKVKAFIALFNKQNEDFNLNNKILLEAIANQVAASLLLKEALLNEKEKERLKRVYY